MELTRRNFLAGAGGVLAAGTLGALPAQYARADESEPTEGDSAQPSWTRAVCEGCPAACTLRVNVSEGRVSEVTGDAENPWSQGALCARGRRLADVAWVREAATGELVDNPRRLGAPRVRRSGRDTWEDISWEMALNEIAGLVKQVRDETFIETEGEVAVRRTDALASFGGSRLMLEEQFLLARTLRSWGVVNIDNEAAFGRRAFAKATAATFGVSEPDGLWSDAAHASVIVTVGSDHGASQPAMLRWIERAREGGARWIVVDPLRTRTAEMADVHVPLRPGTDTAFFGGLIRYVMENSLWQPEYVLNFTNASYLIEGSFGFDTGTGLFLGWDPTSGSYATENWAYQTESFDTWNMRFDGEFAWVRGEGVPIWTIPAVPKPRRNITLQDGASVWALQQAFINRYDLDTVSAVCGVDRALLESVYAAIGATGTVDSAAKILAGPGLVQHGTGAQAVRAAAVSQLLLGNVGIPGGGMHYLGGEPGDASADAVGLAPGWFGGGLPVPTVATPTLQAWLEAHTAPAGTGSLAPKQMVSVLKEWWGEAASAENDYGFDWLPKAPGSLADGYTLPVAGALTAGSLRGCFVWDADLLAYPNAALGPQDLANLDWLVVADSVSSATASFWRLLEDAAAVSTTVFLLPVAAGPEKEGIRPSGSRLLQYQPAAVAPFSDSRSEAQIVAELFRRVRNLYDTKGGTAPDPILNVRWDFEEDGRVSLPKIAWALNGFRTDAEDPTALLENADGLRADGSAACGAGCFAGCWNNAQAPFDGSQQPVGRVDGTDETGLGLYAQWGFSWPRNVRVRGNRASANLAGAPWRADRNLVQWDGQAWVCADAADFTLLREGRWIAPDNCAFPGVWEEVGLLFSDRMGDGPFPEHYEAVESPLNNRLNSSYASPVMLEATSRSLRAPSPEGAAVDAALADALATDYSTLLPDRDAYPIAAVVSNADGRTAWWQTLSEALCAFEPGFFVELSAELARIRGIQSGDAVRVANERGSVVAPALVTERLAPFSCEDSEAHYVVLNGRVTADFEEGATEERSPMGWSVLMPPGVSPVGSARDAKGFLVDIEKA